jgi:hypothetical protein
MRRQSTGIALAVTTLLGVAVPAVAGASVSPPTKVLSTTIGQQPTVLIDSKGTAILTYGGFAGRDQFGGVFGEIRVARKSKGAKKFTPEKLPGEATNDNPFLFQPSAGVLELLVTGNGGLDPIEAWKSTDDGVKWTAMDTDYLNNASWRANSIYLHTSDLSDAPGGPILNAGNDGDPAAPIMQINPSLTKVTKVAEDTQTMYQQIFGQTPSGVTFQVGRDAANDPTSYPYEVDPPAGATHTGVATFPSCKTGESSNLSFAVGTSFGVMTQSSCGRVYARTISTSGALGKLTTIGAGPASNEATQVIADAHHHFTAVYVRPGGDLGVSHSVTGTKWTTSAGSIPDALGGGDAVQFSVSTGEAQVITYLLSNSQQTGYRIFTMPLADTYKPPKFPSAKGIHDPIRVRVGSFAAVLPGRIGGKGFRPHGRSTARVVDVLGGKPGISIEVDRPHKSETLELCSGGATKKLKPGQVTTLHLTCGSGAIVIGGTASSEIPVKKGDHVSYSISCRNGSLSATGKIT